LLSPEVGLHEKIKSGDQCQVEDFATGTSATLSQVSRSRFVSGGGFIRERSKRRVELVVRAEATYRNLARLDSFAADDQ
jgi:hypothetical protein